eukprot:gene10358-12251_t
MVIEDEGTPVDAEEEFGLTDMEAIEVAPPGLPGETAASER